MDIFIIGVDYGLRTSDLPMFSVAKKDGEIFKIIDSGKIENFDYSKYVSTTHQINGELEDLEMFKKQFLKE